MNEINWKKIRKEFAVTREAAFFQSAGMSPIPRKVYKTIRQGYKKIYHSGDKYWQQDIQSMNELLQAYEALVNSEPGNITFIPNTSMGFSLLALSLKKAFGNDFNIITMQDEFPASNVPFEYQGIKVKYVTPDNHRYPVELIEQQVDENTKAIVCSYVQYGTGYRHDLEKTGRLAKEKGLLFIVNATQGFPVFPLDVKEMNIDAFSASLHKWGCAAHVGALFYTSAGFRKKFPSPVAGWLSVNPPEDDFIPTQKNEGFSLHPSAAQYNIGTSNLQSIAGLSAAFDFMNNIGFNSIRERILYLVSTTITLLKDFNEVEIVSPYENPDEVSGILSINLPGRDNRKCVEFLEDLKIATSIRQNNIRIACNYFNNEEDIQRLMNGLRAFICKKETEIS